MERTPEQRKAKARKLIRSYHSKHPANVTHVPGTTLNFARWEVQLDGLTVHFYDYGNRVWYLGEYEPRPEPTQNDIDNTIRQFNQDSIWRL